MDFSTLFSDVDLAAAVAGLLANPLVVTGLTIVLGSVFAPRLIRFLLRSFGRG